MSKIFAKIVRPCPILVYTTIITPTTALQTANRRNHISKRARNSYYTMLIRYTTLFSALAAGTAFANPLFLVNDVNTTVSKRGNSMTPVMGGMNFPDPAMIRIQNSWYAFATNAKVNGVYVHVQMASTNDFVHWTHAGTKDALPTLPAWVDAANPRVWAPDVVQLDNGRFVMYFTAATKQNTALHCLGVATSNNVLGPYVSSSSTPWACHLSVGGAIDPAGYTAKDGTRWVVYKIDGNSIGHGGNCNNGVAPIVSTPILIQQVAADGITKIGAPSAPLITNGPHDGPVVEAPSVSQMPDGTFVLFFSSNCYATPLYDVSYATAKHITGPYTKYGPLLVTGMDGLAAPGGLDIAVNGNHAVFHADWTTSAGKGRAMFAGLISGKGNQWNIYAAS